MENEKEQSNLKDQLCHIFIYGKSTICLVCKRVISRKTNPDIRQERIVDHLRSFDHLESGRALFTMCIPDPICDTEDGRCLDIVTKSVFDISVTLGEESSYICQKDEYLVCLMCRTSISEITSSFTQVIGNIYQHLRSAVHAISVKEVCWFYRLNSKNDYLLFHKSVLHCSICEETFQCLETELVQTAVTHLASDSHEAKQQLSVLDLNKTRKLDRESPKNNKFCDDSEILQQKYSLESIESEVDVEMLNHIEYVEEDEMLNEPKCKKGKRNMKTQTGQKQSKMEGMLSYIGDDVSLVPVGYNNFYKAVLNDSSDIIKMNHQFLYLNEEGHYCTLCCKQITVSGLPKTPKKSLANLQRHFTGKRHIKMLREYKGENNDIPDELDSESLGRQSLGVVENTLQESASNRVSTWNQNKCDQTLKAMSNRTQRIEEEEEACHHYGRTKVLDKCKNCLKDTHLASDSHKAKQQLSLLGLNKTRKIDRESPNNNTFCDDSEILEQKYSLESIKSEVDVEMLNYIEYVEEDKTLNEPKCKKRKRDIKMQSELKQSNLEQKYSLESIKSEVDAEMPNHIEYVDEDKMLNEPKCKKGKQEMETQTGQKQSKIERFLSDIGDDEDKTLNEPKCKKRKRDIKTQTEQKPRKMEGLLSGVGDNVTPLIDTADKNAHRNKKSDKINTFLNAVLNNTSEIIKVNRRFVDINNEGAVCILCCKQLPRFPKNTKIFLTHLKGHFRGRPHLKMLQECKRENKDIPEELNSESFGWQSGFVENISQDNVTSESMSNGDPNICSQTVSSRTKRIEDKVCGHYRALVKNKVLNKCKKCLKKIISKVNSDKEERIYLSVIKNKCFCSLCRFNLSTINLASLTASYFDHCEGNSHKQRLEKYWLNKKEMKERRKLIKKMKKEENKGKVKKKPSAKAKKRRIKEKLKKNKQIKGKNNQE